MKIELLVIISVKKRNNYLPWPYDKFILCAESELCFAWTLKNDSPLAFCSKLLDTRSCRVFSMVIWFLVQLVNKCGSKALA